MTWGQMMLFFPKSVLFICGLTEVLETVFSPHEKNFPAFFIQIQLPLKQPIALPK